jgi:hypothetical protein
MREYYRRGESAHGPHEHSHPAVYSLLSSKCDAHPHFAAEVGSRRSSGTNNSVRGASVQLDLSAVVVA